MKKKGFTLIELIAVLVIMAILALIVTPLVMSIIRKARISADKRSIDAYGRSVELAIASYLLDNGSFPTSIEQLTIEYSGDEIVCSTTQLNPDSSVYLTGCTVGGRSLDYEYGIDKSPTYTVYSVGDEVTYNGVDYYVIKDSGAKEETVTLLKAKSLSTEEITSYKPEEAQISTSSGIQFHSSSNVYNGSYVETTVDAWAAVNVPGAIEVRLLTIDDLVNLGYSETIYSPGQSTPHWVYSAYICWTMSPSYNSSNMLRTITMNGSLSNAFVSDRLKVRPVITISKSVL